MPSTRGKGLPLAVKPRYHSTNRRIPFLIVVFGENPVAASRLSTLAKRRRYIARLHWRKVQLLGDCNEPVRSQQAPLLPQAYQVLEEIILAVSRTHDNGHAEHPRERTSRCIEAPHDYSLDVGVRQRSGIRDDS